MSEVIITIHRYARRGDRIDALAPIAVLNPEYAVRRAAQMASGGVGIVVLAQDIDDRGEVIKSVELARYGPTPEEPQPVGARSS
jgi:hypothetical protein